jgi:hypothetical protein
MGLTPARILLKRFSFGKYPLMTAFAAGLPLVMVARAFGRRDIAERIIASSRASTAAYRPVACQRSAPRILAVSICSDNRNETFRAEADARRKASNHSGRSSGR